MEEEVLHYYGQMMKANMEREAANEDALNGLARLSRNIKELKAYFTQFEASEGQAEKN